MSEVLDELEKWIKIMRCCLIVMVFVLFIEIIRLLLKLGAVVQVNDFAYSVIVGFMVSVVVSLPVVMMVVRR